MNFYIIKMEDKYLRQMIQYSMYIEKFYNFLFSCMKQYSHEASWSRIAGAAADEQIIFPFYSMIKRKTDESNRGSATGFLHSGEQYC